MLAQHPMAAEMVVKQVMEVQVIPIQAAAAAVLD
jgi:hypothetical protein